MKKTILCLLCLLWGMAAGAQENLVRGKRYYENRNYAAALPLLQDAAKEGYGEACYLLGRMYDFGLGVEQNYPIALRMPWSGTMSSDSTLRAITVLPVGFWGSATTKDSARR